MSINIEFDPFKMISMFYINKLLINLIKSYKNRFEKTYETKILIDSIKLLAIKGSITFNSKAPP